MRRYLIPILAILLLASGLTVGCGQKDKPSLTEKQVVDYLYGYLMFKNAEKLQGADSELMRININATFQIAVLDALEEVIQDQKPGSNLDQVEVSYGDWKWTVYVDCLKKLADYHGQDWWEVTLGTQSWRLNERTKEVEASNEEAKQLLQNLAHNEYSSTLYNFRMKYPVGWTAVQLDNKTAIVSPEQHVSIVVAAEVHKLQAGESLGEYASGIASVTGLFGEAYSLDSLIKLPNGNYQAEYEYKTEGIQMWSRVYFLQHNDWVYMIHCSAPKSAYESYLPEFEYSYSSFTFD